MINANTKPLNHPDILRFIRTTRLLGVALFFLVFATTFLSASIASASAVNVYVAQNSAGAANGADCADAFPASWFNSAANWQGGSSQIGAGTTVHLCGTITSTLQAQGNGSSGSPITILFESGANLSQPYCPSGGCMVLDGRSYVTVNGNNTGIIQSTANGSALSNKQQSTGISAAPCNNCVIENLTIQNIYVHSSASDDSEDQTLMRCIWMSGSNWAVHDNTMHDAGFCVYNYFGNGDTNVRIYNNNIYNVDHGVTPNGYGSVSASHFYVYNNHIHDYANWDTTSDAYHHDGVHAYGTGGANLTDLEIYDNQFDGNTGVNFTSHIYIEKPDSSASLTNTLVFNNVLDGTKAPANTFGLLGIGALSGAQVYNNTIVGTNINANYCVLISGGNAVLKNNLMSGCADFIYEYSSSSGVTLNDNTYAAVGSCGWGDPNGGCYQTIAAWRSFSGQDSASQLVASASLSSTYVPSASSPAVTAGVNLTSLGITLLDSDKAATARSTSGSWVAGAFNTGTTASQPAPPTGLLAIAQ
jgi:hypothetical protein